MMRIVEMRKNGAYNAMRGFSIDEVIQTT